MFWTPPSIPWLTLCLWFIWLGTASWNFLATSSECQRKSLLEDMLCTFQPLAKGDLVDHVLHTLIMYKDCLGIMKEQCKNSRLPHLLTIVVHGETLWSPACSAADGWWLSLKDPLFWCNLSPKDPYIWGAWWHSYVTFICESPPLVPDSATSCRFGQCEI